MAIDVKKIIQNSVYQAAGKVLATILGLITLRIVIDYTTQEQYGQYATMIAFLTFVSVIADMGLYHVLVQTLALKKGTKERAKKINTIITLRTVGTVALFLIAPLIALLFPYSAETKQFIALGILAFMPLGINQVLIAIFQKELKMHYVVHAELIGRIVFLSGVVIVTIQEWPLIAVIGALIIGNTLNLLISLIAVRGLEKIQWQPQLRYAKEIMKKAWPLAIVIIMNLIYFRIDAIMISMIKGEQEVAVYSVAYKVLEIATILPALLLGLILPHLAVFHKEGKKKELNNALFYLLGGTVTLVLPVVVGGIMLSEEIITLLTQGKIIGAGAVLQYLMIAVGVIFFGSLFNNGIIATEKQRSITGIYVLGAVLSVGLNLIAIPYYASQGAAITTIIVEAVVMIGVAMALRKEYKWKWPIKQAGKAIFATLIMGGVLYLTKEWPLLVNIAIGIATYGIVMVIVKGVSKEQYRQYISKKK